MRARERGSVAAFCVLAALWGGCGERSDPDAGLPPGAFLVGDAAPLRRALTRLEGLDGTPLARAAREIIERIATCDQVEAHAPNGRLDALIEDLRCTSAPGSAALVALRRDADLAFALPVVPGVEASTAGPRLRGGISVSADGSVSLDAALHPLPERGPLAFVLPGESEPGPARLNTDDRLVHLRLRPAAGLDVAALVPEGSQGDDLFKLKSELFAGAVLDGDLEVVVYMPREGRTVPPMALAVGVTMRAAAVGAIDGFLRDLEETWPLHAQLARFGDDYEIPGRCILDLQILPEFAPCYAATESSLVIGWNPPSVAQALARPQAASEETGAGGLWVALSRLPEADRRLHEAIAPDLPEPALLYGWERLLLEGRREGEQVRVRVELIAGEAT